MSPTLAVFPLSPERACARRRSWTGGVTPPFAPFVRTFARLAISTSHLEHFVTLSGAKGPMLRHVPFAALRVTLRLSRGPSRRQDLHLHERLDLPPVHQCRPVRHHFLDRGPATRE